MESHYDILGVPENAIESQLKAAYRKRALKLHPDTNQYKDDAADDFIACKEAYETLSNAEKRRVYDMQRLFKAKPSEMIGGLFNELLGQRFSKKKGENLFVDVDLVLDDLLLPKKRITVEVDCECACCAGTGAEKGREEKCPKCGGKGEEQKGSLFALPKVCDACLGQGRFIRESCKACSGIGLKRIEKHYDLSLPSSLRNGDTRVLRGAGKAGMHGGKAGDLHIRIRLNEHPFFKRRGSQLLLTMPVDFTMLAKGGEIVVPTLRQSIKMKVPKSTENGAKFRIAKHGLNGGDLIVTLEVEIPTDLSQKQIELLDSFTKSLRDEQCPQQSFFRHELRRKKENGSA